MQRIRKIDLLIQESRTGNAARLAEKMGVSVRTIYRTIRLMKELGAPISYNILLQSYCYKEVGCFVCEFSTKHKYKELHLETTPFSCSVSSMTEYIEKMNANWGLNSNN